MSVVTSASQVMMVVLVPVVIFHRFDARSSGVEVNVRSRHWKLGDAVQ